MPELRTRSALTPDVITEAELTPVADPVSRAPKDAQPTPVPNGVSHPPVLVSEQEVRFSTAAAVPPRPRTITDRLIEAIRVVGAALRPPPARRHHPQRFSYLERALMSREMDRL